MHAPPCARHVGGSSEALQICPLETQANAKAKAQAKAKSLSLARTKYIRPARLMRTATGEDSNKQKNGLAHVTAGVIVPAFL